MPAPPQPPGPPAPEPAEPSRDTSSSDEIEINGVMATAALAVPDSSTLETLSRPLLSVLHKLTDLDSVYLTEIRPSRHDQVIRFADNIDRDGGIVIAEDFVVDWEDSVCRRSLESGIRSTDDVDRDLPGSMIARELGIRSYVGVPVISRDNELLGTLCAAGSRPVEVTSRFMEAMTMIADLMADRWLRDREATAAIERAETAEQRLVERATFLAEAEHLLKSPMTVLRGWSEMLADDWTEMSSTERSEALQTMRRASKDAAQQLEQLLEEARGEVLSHRLAPVPVRLDEIVGEIVDQLTLAAGPSHQVSGDWPEETDNEGRPGGPTVIVDRYALWQVLWHLGENAVKYSPHGGRIDYLVERLGDDEFAIEIRDEGLGIPAGLDIFAPFVRGSNSESGVTRGTGLGLHIVRTLVQAMGGSVTAQPRQQGGSVFRVLLPAAAEQADTDDGLDLDDEPGDEPATG